MKSRLANHIKTTASEASPVAQHIRKQDQQIARLKTQLEIERKKQKNAETEIDTLSRRLGFLDSLGEPVSTAWAPQHHKSRGRATAIVVLSDWHTEERVDPRTISGMNAFDLDIAAKRIKTCFQKACELIDAERRMSQIRDLVLAVLGDMITGYIHEELVEGNYLSPTEACLFVQDQLSSGIDYIRKHAGCKSVTVACSYGNHGRTTLKKRIATGAKNSYEWLLYNQLARTYKNTPNLRWQIANGMFNWLNIQNKNIRLHHGDTFKYMGGIGGITVPILRGIAQLDRAKTADLDIFGHWHQFMSHRKFIVNNSLIGFSAYAADVVKADYSPPSQTLVVLDSTKKQPTVVKEIFVG